MSRAIGTLLALVMIGFLITFGIMYMTASFAVLDQGVDVSGTDYEDTYDSTKDTAKVGVAFMAMMPYFLGVAGLILAFAFMRKLNTTR